MRRTDLLAVLADRVERVRPAAVALVAIDGVDEAGKTTLARELSAAIEKRGRAVVEVSIDAFHQPSTIRYRQGRESDEGYYRDSFDLDRFREFVLEPLEAGGSASVRRACHDLGTDARLEPDPVSVPPGAVVLVEGIFLHRPELRDAWDFSIFLRTTFEVTVARAIERDGGDGDAVRRSYQQRYVPGQQLYLREADPERHADWVVDHDDPQSPSIVRAP